MAHPVRPESYIQVFNFYTATIYNKGAEVVRMLCNLLGWDDFRRGCDVYFARHDGQAVTCEDFVAAMEAVSGIDLTQFQRWYSQAGTPELTVRGEYDADNQRYTLHIAQHTPPTAKQPEKLPLHIPLAVGLLDSQGNDMPLSPRSPEAEGKEEGMSNASHFPQGEDAFTVVLPLRDSEHTFVFDNIPEAPIPSLLRNFSAPVKIKYERDENELAFLLAHDSDAFNRWDAGQQLAIKALLRQIEAAQNGAPLPERFAAALGEAMDDASIDKALLEAIMSLPESSYVADQCDVIDVDAIDAAYRFTRRYLAECLHERLLRVYQDNAVAGAYRFNKDDASRRGLRNTCLAYLANSEAAEDIQRCYTQFQTADNMSEIFPALAILCEYDVPERQLALDAFYDKWQHDEQVTLKWLGVQTANTFPDALTRVKQLMQHPAFDANNPNKIRAVIGGFCGGMSIRFHAKDGSGYDFIRGQILEQDKVNPKIAARLAHSLIRYKRYDSARAELMRTALENIAGQDNLSTDVYEVVNAGLEN